MHRSARWALRFVVTPRLAIVVVIVLLDQVTRKVVQHAMLGLRLGFIASFKIDCIVVLILKLYLLQIRL